METLTIIKRIENAKSKDELQDLIRDLKADYLKEGNVKGKKDITIIKNFIKGTFNPTLKGSYFVKDTENTYALCDGYRLLETISKEAEDLLKEFYNKEITFNTGYENITSSIDDVIEYEVDTQKLDETIKRNSLLKRTDKPHPFIISYGENNIIALNCSFLKDFITLMKTNKIYIEKNPTGILRDESSGEKFANLCISPISIVGNDYRGIILPIRVETQFCKKCLEEQNQN